MISSITIAIATAMIVAVVASHQGTTGISRILWTVGGIVIGAILFSFISGIPIDVPELRGRQWTN